MRSHGEQLGPVSTRTRYLGLDDPRHQPFVLALQHALTTYRPTHRRPRHAVGMAHSQRAARVMEECFPNLQTPTRYPQPPTPNPPDNASPWNERQLIRVHATLTCPRP